MASIFLVEDELSVLDLYSKVLEAYGFKVMGMAKNGEEAVEMYKNFNPKPDIIIMDHRMPIKSGIEATKDILQIDRFAKIVFASADDSVKEYAKSIGALCFKNKPFSNEKLIKNINKALQLTDYQTL
ncbi:MAG: response regulator [Promethearchaeota archaeon]